MGCASNNEKSKRNKLKNNMINNSNNYINSNLNNNLNNVKSVYILREIFDIIPKNERLGIIKYNKKLQKKLNLSVNDYKEYSSLYSSIEIEIKTANNEYGKFVNISESDKKYYHIFLMMIKKKLKEII